ncbi:4'-phosphopantetheinyl transferase superfamily protein [Fulvimarina sp. 2208YS6-2-32]|uniref:4'-phosphopantetheinyl transferase superfamily protein n=1 Tax=Fulvimarina uroteuthidis TaxID=3098149 RepID=A0ABU5HXE1_9HYPH|nr:4'-phosphopantetheinyl transferase superfamily protein [Fulvimarina sp. 2208YS6-2-32]MDY8107636.1 4'-phosphopantetheinyl transferase superfamily protein [Fulvimarina sp. 2208YS6-2-32]
MTKAETPDAATMRPAGADIFLAPIDRITPDALSACQVLLDAGEADRHDRFRVQGARQEFLVGRALLRTRLSAACPNVAPSDWRFSPNAYGRPSIDWRAMGGDGRASAEPSDLFFNLSHTRGLVALAIGPRQEIGIDVEAISRGAPGQDVARRYFTTGEADWIEGDADEGARTERFFALWTLKEAYIKARGMGLSLPLDGFFFDCSKSPPPIAFNGKIDDVPSRWRFSRRTIGPQHRLALALPADFEEPRFFEVHPPHGTPAAFAPGETAAFP